MLTTIKRFAVSVLLIFWLTRLYQRVDSVPSDLTYYEQALKVLYTVIDRRYNMTEEEI